ncbi:MAG: metallophosphoesterase [Methanobrevibacter sp.]|nr:metallophosphoesterase [Methanobrevibacter sp.]
MKPIKTLNFSDIHLGCPRLDAEWMVMNLLEFIFSQIEKTNPDMIVIQGDLFDNGLSLADNSIPFIFDFICTLLVHCQQNNILLRILRGTLVHDRTQPAMFSILHQKMKLKGDIKYFDTIDVEYIPKFDLRVGYIPDNTPFGSSEETIEKLQEKMEELKWKELDYLYMHGSFDFTLPIAAHKHCKVLFKTEQFSFVKRYVVTGHIHKHAIKGNVINNGSLDRLCHNEEEPKGCVFIDDKGDSAQITFIENKKASIFSTIDLSQQNLEEDNLVSYVSSKLSTYSPHVQTNIKILHPLVEVRSKVVEKLRKLFPKIKFNHERKPSNEIYIPEEDTDDEEDILITPATLPFLIEQNTPTITKEKAEKLLAMAEDKDDISSIS